MTTPLALLSAGSALFSTRRHAFLTQMQQWLPWAELVALVAPYYYAVESGRGRPRVDLELMLRLYCLQQGYDLSDPATEEEVTDSLSMRHFAGLSLAARVPDETTLCTCRHLLAAHALGTRIFALIQQHLAGLGFRLRQGTVMDAALIEAPTSTQNQSRQRDPEMHSPRKGQPWSCGMKLHIGIDRQSGLIHHLTPTPAQVHDSQMAPLLLHGAETDVGDTAYGGQADRLREVAPHMTPRIQIKRPRGGVLSGMQRAAHRVRVEHPFRLIKGIFGFRKVRYRGLHKHTQRCFVLCALANLLLGAPAVGGPGGRQRLNCVPDVPTDPRLALGPRFLALPSPTPGVGGGNTGQTLPNPLLSEYP